MFSETQTCLCCIDVGCNANGNTSLTGPESQSSASVQGIARLENMVQAMITKSGMAEAGSQKYIPNKQLIYHILLEFDRVLEKYILKSSNRGEKNSLSFEIRRSHGVWHQAGSPSKIGISWIYSPSQNLKIW